MQGFFGLNIFRKIVFSLNNKIYAYFFDVFIVFVFFLFCFFFSFTSQKQVAYSQKIISFFMLNC